MRTLSDREARFIAEATSDGWSVEMDELEFRLAEDLITRGLAMWGPWWADLEGQEFADLLITPLGKLALSCYRAARVAIVA